MVTGLWNAMKDYVPQIMMVVGALSGGVFGLVVCNEHDMRHVWVFLGLFCGMYIGFLGALFTSK